MKPTYLLFLFALVCCLAGCKTNGGELLVLDVERAIDTKQQFDLSSIADDCEFIPLDNSNQEEGLIGDIWAIKESKNRFYVIDRTDNPVKLFDRNGEFIATRGRVGRGPDEFLSVNEVTVDWERDNLYIMAYNGGRASHSLMRAYGADGEIFARNDSITTGKIAYFDDKVLLFTDSQAKPTEIGEMYTFAETFSPDLHRETALEVPFKGPGSMILITSDAEGQITSISIHKTAPVVVTNNGASLLVKEGRSNTVYHHIDGALEPFLRLDFGSYAIPAEMYEPSYNKPVSEKKHYGVRNIFEGDRYILVTGTIQPNHFLLFDRQDDYAGFTTLGADGSEGLFLDGVRFHPAYIRDNQLIGYMSALDIVDNAAHITNPDLKALATTLREDSNPVIVTAKLKK
jgi:hypothetical protein